MPGAQRFAALIQRQSKHLQKRPYSFFSSKGSGNGSRYFTGNSNSGSSKAVGGVVGGKEVASKPVASSAVNASPAPSPQAVGVENGTAPSKDEQATKAAPTSSSSTPPMAELAPPMPHPTLTTRTLSLHNFFSLHRPLLLLSNPASSLFDQPSLALTSRQQDDIAREEEREEREEVESESSAAVLLLHSQITSNLSPRLSFNDVLARLGSKEEIQMQRSIEEEIRKGAILLDSVKRKRKKKMSRHKLKKRRRALREFQRRTGK